MDQTEGPLYKMPYSGSLAVQRAAVSEGRGAVIFTSNKLYRKPIACKVFASVLEICQSLKDNKFFLRGTEKINPENLTEIT